jgi:hypothetical protein
MSLTDEEKTKARHHLGYLNVQAAATFQLGVPAAIRPSFMVELAFEKVLPSAANMVRVLLCRLDDVEKRVFDLDMAEVVKTGNVEIREKRLQELANVYCVAQESLGNLFGVPPNPFDMRTWVTRGRAGLNVPVIG